MPTLIVEILRGRLKYFCRYTDKASKMKLTYLILIFLSFQALSYAEEESFFINEKHRYYCGLGYHKFTKTKVSSCQIGPNEQENIDELSGDLNSIVSFYKKGTIRRLCRDDSWSFISSKDESLAEFFPRDRNCLCSLSRRRSFTNICDPKLSERIKRGTEGFYSMGLETISKRVRRMNLLDVALEDIVSDQRKLPTCEIKPIANCEINNKNIGDHLKDLFSESTKAENLNSYQSYLDFRKEILSGMSGVNADKEALKAFRKEVLKAGSVEKLFEQKEISLLSRKHLCQKNVPESLRPLLLDKVFYYQYCLQGDEKGAIEALEKSTQNEAVLSLPMELFQVAKLEENYKKDCQSVQQSFEVLCQMKGNKAEFLDLYNIDFDSLGSGLGLDSRDFKLAKDLSCFKESKKVELPVIASFSTYDSIIDEKNLRTKTFVDNGNKRQQRKPSSIPVTITNVGVSVMEENSESFSEDTNKAFALDTPEEHALASYEEQRREVQQAQSSGSMTQEQKESYQAIESEYEKILGRNLDIFDDNVEVVRKEMMVERGASRFQQITQEAKGLSQEIDHLNKLAQTAGPRERLRIQGRLKRITNRLKTFKKYGFKMDLDIPTVGDIINAGRSDSDVSVERQENSIDIASYFRSSHRDKNEALVQKKEPVNQVQESFNQFKIAPQSLGPAQDFSKNWTTGPTKLLPEKNYPKSKNGQESSINTVNQARNSSAQVPLGVPARSGSSTASARAPASLFLNGGIGSTSGSGSIGNLKTYQVENKTLEPKVLKDSYKTPTKVVFVEDLKVMRVFKLEEGVYKIEGEYNSKSFKENLNRFDREVQLDGEQFFNYRVEQMQKYLEQI